ncbi:hypothetical protein DFJ73DRAFT_341026 [Zopfochytrium polystomum]|nr:hypothetical protein DFJ73DRAFT_341026 [Zopfochytrium polystomum]
MSLSRGDASDSRPQSQLNSGSPPQLLHHHNLQQRMMMVPQQHQQRSPPRGSALLIQQQQQQLQQQNQLRQLQQQALALQMHRHQQLQQHHQQQQQTQLLYFASNQQPERFPAGIVGKAWSPPQSEQLPNLPHGHRAQQQHLQQALQMRKPIPIALDDALLDRLVALRLQQIQQQLSNNGQPEPSHNAGASDSKPKKEKRRVSFYEVWNKKRCDVVLTNSHFLSIAQVVTVGYTYLPHEYDRKCITVDPLSQQDIDEVMTMRRDMLRVTIELEEKEARLLMNRRVTAQPSYPAGQSLEDFSTMRALFTAAGAHQKEAELQQLYLLQQQIQQLQVNQVPQQPGFPRVPLHPQMYGMPPLPLAPSNLQDLQNRSRFSMLASPLSPAPSDLDDVASLTSRPSLDSSRSSSEFSRQSFDSTGANMEHSGNPKQQQGTWRRPLHTTGDAWPRTASMVTDRSKLDAVYQQQILGLLPSNGVPVSVHNLPLLSQTEPSQFPPSAELWDHRKSAVQVAAPELRRPPIQRVSSTLSHKDATVMG